jgi:hypothetical protein
MLTTGRPISKGGDRRITTGAPSGELASEPSLVGGDGSGDDPSLGRVIMGASFQSTKSPFQPDALGGGGYNSGTDIQPSPTHRSIVP